MRKAILELLSSNLLRFLEIPGTRAGRGYEISCLGQAWPAEQCLCPAFSVALSSSQDRFGLAFFSCHAGRDWYFIYCETHKTADLGAMIVLWCNLYTDKYGMCLYMNVYLTLGLPVCPFLYLPASLSIYPLACLCPSVF